MMPITEDTSPAFQKNNFKNNNKIAKYQDCLHPLCAWALMLDAGLDR